MHKYNIFKVVIIIGIALSLSGCVLELGGKVDEALSPWYHYNLFHTKILESPGAIFEPILEVKEADVKTFSVISENYAKDKNHVFFGVKLIKEADSRTAHLPFQFFEQDSEKDPYYMLVDDSHVYYLDHIIDGADPSSFKAWYGGMGSFGVDKNHIFCGDKKMPGTSKNFRHLFHKKYFVNDSMLYYLSGSICEYINNVDVQSLTTFTYNDGIKNKKYNSFIKDKNKVYCLASGPMFMSVIKEADAKTFKALKHDGLTEYAKDKYNVYVDCRVATKQEAKCISNGGVINYISKRTKQCVLDDENGNKIRCSLRSFYDNGKCK